MTFRPAHRRRRNPLDRQVLGVRKAPPPPTCVRCGNPVPAGTAQCAEPCEPDNHCPTCGTRWDPLEVARIPMEEK